MNLNNDIIDKICSDMKFKISGDDCFVLNVGYNYGTTGRYKSKSENKN